MRSEKWNCQICARASRANASAKVGSSCGRLGVHLLRGAVRVGIAGAVEVVVAAEIEVVGPEVLGRLGRDRLVVGLLQRQVQRGRDLLRDPRLDLEHLLQRLVEAPGPEVAVVGDADELRRHPDPARAAGLLPPHAPLEDVVHPQLAPDVLDGLAGLPGTAPRWCGR